jgi:hypothetical protein
LFAPTPKTNRVGEKQGRACPFLRRFKKVEYKKIVKRKASPFGPAKTNLMISLSAKKEKKSSWTQVPNKILDDPRLSCKEKMVLIVLHRYAYNKNNCFPAIKTIAGMSGISVKTIQQILNVLENKHFIKRHTRPGFVSIYELINFGI